jgi:hypothetical protein
MRDPPNSASVSETNVCRNDDLTHSRYVGFAPWRLRVQSPCDEPIPIDEPATESVDQRLATVLFRALAAWPV